MNALLYALANLARLRWLGAAFCALVIVCTTANANAIAPGTENEQTKTRVGGFEQNSSLNVCVNTPASAETNRGISNAQYETASAFSHAAEGAAARTFTSADPLVGNLANRIEAAYPRHVVGVNVPMRNSAGQLVTDADILLQNGVIQVKSGSGAGLTSQLARTQAVTDLPVIGYGPKLGGTLIQNINKAGGLVTRDEQLLLQVVKP